MSKRRICVIGLGYVGLPTACVLAINGYHVIGIDMNEETVNMIKRGETDIEEKDLKTILKRAVDSGRFGVSTDHDSAEECDTFIISVPSPVNADGNPNLEQLLSACTSAARHVKKGTLIIIETTVSPGGVNEVKNILEGRTHLKAGDDFLLAYCPERIFPGNVALELLNNDRVIAGISRESTEKAATLYGSFIKGKIHITDVSTAELVKLFENTHRDIDIAIANQFAIICEKLGANAREAIRIANTHPRVKILNPGCGVGGACIPKDPLLLQAVCLKKGVNVDLIKAARGLNDGMPAYFVNKIISLMKTLHKDPHGKKALVLGLAYKGNVSDKRYSPAEPIIDELRKNGLTVLAYDPFVDDFEGVEILDDPNSTPFKFHLVVLVTDHDLFKGIDTEYLKKITEKDAVIADGRGMFDKALLEKSGFHCIGIG